jgi:hypothetical protein
MSGELSAYLVPPTEPDDSMANDFTNPGDIFNYVSPAAWIADIIERISGWNPFDWATEWLTGEWGEFYKFGTALACVGDFMEQFGAEIQKGELRVDQTWSGNGADAAYNYFTEFASAASQLQFPLKDAGHSYHEAARGIWQLSKQLGNVLQAIVDELILTGLTIAAGAVTAATGVGAFVGGSMAAYQTARLLSLLAKASKIANTALMVIMGLFGGAMAIAGQGGNLSAVRFPEAAFNLPRA